jgi:peptide/nickel transport system permease protein
MTAYIIRRLLLAIPTVIGVCIITFSLFYVIVSPDTMARHNLSSKNPSPGQIKAWKIAHGYDKPPAQQFLGFMKQLLLFNFGSSDSDKEPVADKIWNGMGPSLKLAIPEFIVSLIASISFSLMLAYYRGTYLDVWGTFLCVVLMSVPFLLYFIAGQVIFGKFLCVAPMMGYAPGLAGMRFVLLPAFIALVSGLGGSIRFYRTIMLEEMMADYARTARAKGVSEVGVLFRHILKNAMIPVLTSVVMSIPFLVLGSLLLEPYFGIPGLGTITLDAINATDFAVLRVMVYIGSLLYIVGAILTDISYTLVDPRVRLG